MRKHPKQAFGIYHDGLVVRMVHLVREGDSVYLQGVDHTDLDKYWYKILDDPSVEMVDTKTKESKSATSGEIDIDEFDNDYVTNYQLQPSERMLSAFDLSRGVLALNVYDENIVKNSPGMVSKKEMQAFIKEKVTGRAYKTGDYQSCIVHVGDTPQQWLHRGTNRLLDLIKDYTRKNKIKAFYQLADANDVALTDYFKCSHAEELEHNTLLVYLGQEYRKAFVFQNGKWVQTLKLQITQSYPDPDVISSKLTLALDSGGVEEPERIVVSGDLANADLVENLSEAFPIASVKLFEFSNVIVSATDGDILDYSSLSKFCIPIALAHKALFPEDNCYSKTNFLPGKIVEGQKEFKVAWHGFMILFLIFAFALLGTNQYLKSKARLNTELRKRQELSNLLAQKRGEAAQIKKFEEELALQEQNLQRIGDILENKNYWTRLLDTLNSGFRRKSKSWLSNLTVNKGTVTISGVTSNRNHMIALAQTLPNSKINKVSAAKIRDHTVWSFEMSGGLPQVDWLQMIEDDISRNLEQRSAGELAPRYTSAETKPKAQVEEKVEPLPLRTMHLPPLDNTSLLRYGAAEADTVLSAEFISFANALQQGHIWNYREIGKNFIYNHPTNEYQAAVRWWMAYRMYLDRDYYVALEYLRPLFNRDDKYRAHIQLLQARLYLALGNSEYIQLYESLQKQSNNSIKQQVEKDITAIREGEDND
jgi:Tfp pilus assembly protein PilN